MAFVLPGGPGDPEDRQPIREAAVSFKKKFNVPPFQFLNVPPFHFYNFLENLPKLC